MPRIYNANDPNVPDDAVLVDRTTRWGNMFHVGIHGTRDEVCNAYETLMGIKMRDKEFRERLVNELKGKDLVCHCAPQRCHAETLLRLANDES